jgi:hypothetical protein
LYKGCVGAPLALSRLSRSPAAMRFMSLVAALGLGLGSMGKVKLEHPSQSVVLIYPSSTVNVKMMPFHLGYNDTVGVVDGLQHNVSISLTWPNGTHKELLLGFTSPGICATYPGPGFATSKAIVNVTDVGR